MFKDPCTIALEHDKQLMAIHNAEQSPNEADRFQLVENYVDHIIDGMDTDSLVHICLLYTSPSPRDVEESRMPSSA